MKITTKSLHNDGRDIVVITGEMYEVNGFQYCIYETKRKYMESSHDFDMFDSFELSSGLSTVQPAFKLKDLKKAIAAVPVAKITAGLDPASPASNVKRLLIDKGRKFPLNLAINDDVL